MWTRAPTSTSASSEPRSRAPSTIGWPCGQVVASPIAARIRSSSTGDIACSIRSASSWTSSKGMPSTSVRKRSIMRWRRTMWAPVIGNPASSSQNMISRYSCSATVASLIASILTTLDQGRDDRLVETIAHRPLGDDGVVPSAEHGAQTGVARRPIGDDEEAADRGGDLEVLDRVADGYAVGRVVATDAGVGGDGGRLADQLGDEVVSMGRALDRRHLAADRAVVEQAQVVVSLGSEQPVGLLDVDLAAEEVGEDAPGVPGRVVLEPPLKVLEQ